MSSLVRKTHHTQYNLRSRRNRSQQRVALKPVISKESKRRKQSIGSRSDRSSDKSVSSVDIPSPEADNSMETNDSPSPTPASSSSSRPQKQLTEKEIMQNAHYKNMRKREHFNHVYKPQARYLKYRKVIVEWMLEAGEELSLHKATIHTATRYVDVLLSSSTIAKDRLKLISVCCLLVASKYEERELNIPLIDDLLEHTSVAYDKNMVKAIEVMVLEHLEWRLGVVTPIHFLELFIEKGVVFHNDMLTSGDGASVKTLNYIIRYINFFVDFYLKDYEFQQFTPCVIACAIIAASRRASSVVTGWSGSLESITGMKAKHFRECYDLLWSSYSTAYPTFAQAVSVSSKERPSPSDPNAVNYHVQEQAVNEVARTLQY